MAPEPIGWRPILRNGICYALLVGLADLAGLPEGLFLALAAMTVMEVNLGDGVVAGRQRVLATLAGTAVTVLVLGALGRHDGLGAGLAFLLLRLLIFRFRLEGGLVVGGHVLAGSFGQHLGNWGFYVFWRTVQTLAGVLVGLVVARSVLPSRNRERWLAELRSWLQELAWDLRHCAQRLAPPPAESGAAAEGEGRKGWAPAPMEAQRQRRDALEHLARASLPEAANDRIAAHWRHVQEGQLDYGLAIQRCLRELMAAVELPEVLDPPAGADRSGGGDRPEAADRPALADPPALADRPALSDPPTPDTPPLPGNPFAAGGPLAADTPIGRALRNLLTEAAACLEALARQREPERADGRPLQRALGELLAAAADLPAAGREGAGPEGVLAGAPIEALQRVRLVGLYALALSGNDQPLPASRAGD